jgi:hypothetical protein
MRLILERGIQGGQHPVSAEHLATDMEEMPFRFNRRDGSGLRDPTSSLFISPILASYLRTTKTPAASVR